jgi:hypothetical protein
MKNLYSLTIILIAIIFSLTSCNNKKLAPETVQNNQNLNQLSKDSEENKKPVPEIDPDDNEDQETGDDGKPIILPETFDDPSSLFKGLSSMQSKSAFCRAYYKKNIRNTLKAELSAIHNKDINKPDSAKSSAISALMVSTAGTFINAIDNQGCEKDPSGHVKTVYKFVVQGAKLLNIPSEGK